MFPYRDDNPTLNVAAMTLATIGVTGAVWLFVQGAGSEPGLTRSVCDLGATPARILGRTLEPIMTARGPLLPCGDGTGGGSAWPTPLTSVFLHGSWFHLIGNMWFLWIFGNNIEDVMGRLRFVGFYLICGIAAAMAQALADPGSPVPMVGASGAVSGVMGAYLVLYPHVRVHNILFLGFFVTSVTLPAWGMLLYWTFIQLLGSAPMLAGARSAGGVAFLAHLGGFAAGTLLTRAFVRQDLLVARRRAGPGLARWAC